MAKVVTDRPSLTKSSWPVSRHCWHGLGQSMICQQSQQILADFILAFLAFVGKKLYLPRIVGSTGGLLPSKIGRVGNLPNQSLLKAVPF